MGGFFGTVAKAECVTDLFYGTDYNSHLGTKTCRYGNIFGRRRFRSFYS